MIGSATADRILNAVLYYAGWIGGVALFGLGMPTAGMAVTLSIALLHVALSERRRSEAALVLAVSAVGFVVESALAAANVVAYPHGRPTEWLCAPWIVTLWSLFATTLRFSMAWFTGHLVPAALLGAVAGPLSYRAGAAAGAVELSRGAISLAVLAVVWSLVFSGLVVVTRRTGRGDGAGRYRRAFPLFRGPGPNRLPSPRP